MEETGFSYGGYLIFHTENIIKNNTKVSHINQRDGTA